MASRTGAVPDDSDKVQGTDAFVARGLFRADLYYRLSGVEIHVPPLRSRSEDVPELVRYFLGRHRSRELSLSTEAEHALLADEGPSRCAGVPHHHVADRLDRRREGGEEPG